MNIPTTLDVLRREHPALFENRPRPDHMGRAGIELPYYGPDVAPDFDGPPSAEAEPTSPQVAAGVIAVPDAPAPANCLLAVFTSATSDQADPFHCSTSGELSLLGS